MRTTLMPRDLAHIALPCLLALVSLACAAAPSLVGSPPGGAPGGARSAGSAASMPIIMRSNGASSPSGTPDHLLTVSASCAPGEHVVGGGFAAGDVFEFAAFIYASYPSAANTWTVVGDSISAFSLTAVVYCAPASPALGVRVSAAQAGNRGARSAPLAQCC